MLLAFLLALLPPLVVLLTDFPLDAAFLAAPFLAVGFFALALAFCFLATVAFFGAVVDLAEMDFDAALAAFLTGGGEAKFVGNIGCRLFR